MSIINNRPLLKKDSNYIPIQLSSQDMEMRADYLAGTDRIYEGFARPGKNETDAVWQIKRYTYDVNHNITKIEWPQNASGAVSSDYEFQWSARASYTYA